MTQPQIIYTSRTPYQAYQRCKRMRWNSTHEGPRGVGLEPRRKSLHLVVGGAVHAGMEVLLREGQQALDAMAEEAKFQKLETSLAADLDILFPNGRTKAREIEDRAVVAALADLTQEMAEGVELDAEEAKQQQDQGVTAEQLQSLQDSMGELLEMSPADVLKGQLRGSLRKFDQQPQQQEDSPIVISFDDLIPVLGAEPKAGDSQNEPAETKATSMQEGRTGAAYSPTGATSSSSTSTYHSDADYLREELAALVEGMTRAYARRRWRPLLEQFEVLEVEREGEWKLAEWHGDDWQHDYSAPHQSCSRCGVSWEAGKTSHLCQAGKRELHFLSRHDALLLERSTQYLYLQSYKTTGTWDRRRELDAQVDMQGLSEAVDVEQRFGEAWELLHKEVMVAEAFGPSANLADNAEYLDASQRVRELVSDRVAHWLRTQPDPPTILGVRYEYLLKGLRKQDKKEGSPTKGRWCQESILVRAYKQEGITTEDRRWAWTYDWRDELEKGRRLDYRSWQKAPVWRWQTIAQWIDQLDQGVVQEGALDEQGEPLDPLAAQFVPPIVQYRNKDEMLDLLEQMEAQEIEIAKDVEEVRQAEREGGYAARRSALNRLFPQNRQACSYPGICQYRSTQTQPGFCFGAAGAEQDPMVLERFRERRANHPKELEQQQQQQGQGQELVQIRIEQKELKQCSE